MTVTMKDLEAALRDLKAAEVRVMRTRHVLSDTTMSKDLDATCHHLEHLRGEVKELIDFRKRQTNLEEYK